jgi:hypothetical protein
VVALERARRHAERLSECVQLIEGYVAHQVRPVPTGGATFTRPDRTVDEDHAGNATVAE